MQIESDEEYYDKEKFNKVMQVEIKDKQTEASGSAKKDEMMEVEADQRRKDRKFIAESEDDEDDEFFNQLQQTKKTVDPIQSLVTKANNKPVISQPVPSKPKPLVKMKGGLAGWLKDSK